MNIPMRCGDATCGCRVNVPSTIFDGDGVLKHEDWDCPRCSHLIKQHDLLDGYQIWMDRGAITVS